jgi:hypothetical protein
MNYELFYTIRALRNKVVHGFHDNSNFINEEKLYGFIQLLFPKANIDVLKKRNNKQFEILSLIDQTLIKPKTAQWFNEILGDKTNHSTLLLDEIPSPIWCYLGAIKTNSITFVSDNLQTQEYFKILFSDAEILTRKQFDESNSKFDLIIVNIPFFKDNTPGEEEFIYLGSDNGKSLRVGRSVAYLSNGLQHLEKDGTQLAFSNNTRLLMFRGLIELLQYNFKLKGIFQSTDNTFFSNSPLVPEILYFTHGNSNEVFVGIIGETTEQQHLLIDNFRKNRVTKTVSTGKSIPIKQFISVKNLESKEKYEILARQAGGILKTINELSIPSGWKRLRNNNLEELSHLESSVFIPLVGKQPVVTNPASIVSSIQNTVQVILDPTLVLPDYFAQILNQEIGYQLKMNASIGRAQQSLNKDLFLSSEFPLPSLPEQNRILELSRKLNDAAITLNTLHIQLWKRPSKYVDILTEYKKKFKEPIPDEWIEILPYPLASILRLYYAKSEPSKKFECLLLFYEALSEFLSNLFLSSFNSDEEFYKENCTKLIGYTPEFKNWFLKSDFGGWNNLFSNLSKSTRTYLNDNKTKERVQSILGNPSQLFIENLTAKKISEILSTVCQLRSDWKGHTGITSDLLYKERVSVLENHLVSIKEYLINAFDDCSFHIAGKMTYSNGYYQVETKLLKGSHSIFKDEILNVSIPMVEGSQYILHSNQNRPIKLLPLIKLMASPSSVDNACYFYNRMEKNKNIRLISYHFDGQPEKTIEDLELLDAINLLNPPNI